ncbi:thymidylate synthase [Shouchella clausii]|uniref:thymidylate synthase n=1 Tax=Shouchella clausii TaxID=79880 RepID=UPI002DB817C5|nr:thymidylate synthase [Shouchella clausii]MEB5480921.1 thymidylate synthase [Shouchella clausii]
MDELTNNADKQYLELCKLILEKGVKKEDRTGTGTLSVFGHQMRFNLSEGFPLLTTKRVPFRIVAEELLWFLRGSTDVGELVRKNISIWNPDAYRFYCNKMSRYSSTQIKTYEEFVEAAEVGYDLGPIYGAQWRSWSKQSTPESTPRVIDQIAEVIKSIQTNPYSRRHIVSAWNVGELEEMALPPCHTLFQFYVADNKLSCQLYQRSADVFLGLPFNISSYALLTHMIAKITDLEVGEFIHTIGDAHIYLNHVDAVNTQLSRSSKELPSLSLVRKVDDPAEYTFDDIKLIGYDPHETIKAPLSVGK